MFQGYKVMDRCRHGALDSLVSLKVFHVKALHDKLSAKFGPVLVLKLSVLAKIRFKKQSNTLFVVAAICFINYADEIYAETANGRVLEELVHT